MKQETPAEKAAREELERVMDWVEQYGVDTESFAKYTKKQLTLLLYGSILYRQLRENTMNEIQYAVQEACSMNLSTEQSIKFVMRVSNCNREIAKQAINNRAVSAHYEATNFVTS